MEDKNTTVDEGRRKFMRKAVYVTPAVLTLSAMPFTASYGSQQAMQSKPWDKPYKKWNKSDRRHKSHRWNQSENWDK